MIGETPPCFPRAPSLGEATQIYLNSWQSPSSSGLKNKPGAVQAHRVGATGSQSPGWGGGRQNCQLRASSSHQHGAPAFLLKDRLRHSLKDANVAADIWEILAGDQTRAENRSCWAGAGTRQQGPGWSGPRATGLGQPSLAGAVLSDSAQPGPTGYLAVC